MQNLLQSNSQIGIQGWEGSYHEQAALELGIDASRLACMDSFGEVYDAVRTGRLGGALVAIVNNSVGYISPSYNELVYDDDVWISGETYTRVDHQLLALPGTSLEDIVEVRSQAPALAQCDRNLRRYLPGAKRVERNDTAASAREINVGNLKDVAAVASPRAGDLYGLEVVQPNIQDREHNITRFLFIEPRRMANTPPDANKTTMMLDVPEQTGALAWVSALFADNDINLKSILSQPIPDSAFDSNFFLEFGAGLQSEKAEKVIARLLQKGCGVHVLGSYVSAPVPMRAEK